MENFEEELLEKQNAKKEKKKGIFIGIAIGAGVGIFLTTVVAIIVIFTIFLKKPEVYEVPDNYVDKIGYLYGVIDQYYLNDIKEEDMMEGLYKGLLDAVGDPYTVYYTKDEFAKFMEDMSGEYYGIGVMVSQEISTKIITITRVFDNAPSSEAGLKAGDIIYKVADTDVTSMDVDNVVSLIKGTSGSKVKITVIRDGKELDFQVERREVIVPTVEHKMLDNQIGYIEIIQFEDKTDEQYVKAYNELKAQGMKGLIVDVRDNPGGSLDTVLNILDNVLPKGLVVYTIDKNGKRVEYDCKGKNEIDIPLVVLTNGNSASASEIFAAAIKDYNKGTILGTTTFGKGIVQRIIPFSDGSAIKITVSTYYSPLGKNIHGEGVTPDIELDYDYESSDDNQLKRAIEELLKQI